MKPLSLYIHWPFCVSKCPYCDFASRPMPGPVDEGAWVEAYVRELAFYAARLPGRELSSLYFGGGTPSLMRPQSVARLLSSVARFWPVAAESEITLEANPSSSEREKFLAFRDAGINRLSLGAQSFDDEALRFLGRAHDAGMARRAIEAAAAIFGRFSFDLIYARRGQTVAAWEKEVEEALSFSPKHLSLYQLTLEPGTVFSKRAATEQLQTDEETSALLFEATQEILEKAGLPAYEISNHAAPGQESRHNLTYWHYGDYIGIGPAAHGRFVDEGGLRWATENTSQPFAWLAQTQKEGYGQARQEALSASTAQTEALLMGLRLAEGISFARWRRLFGFDLERRLPPDKMAALIQEGLLEKTKTAIRATKAGRQRLNALLAYLES